MIEAENDDSIPNKRFKYYDESEENCSSVENVLSTSKAETEAGSYFLGPHIIKYITSPVTVRLGKKKDTGKCYLLKTLVLDDNNMLDRDLSIRKRVFHNEYTILSALRNQEGIIQLHDFFKEYIQTDVDGRKNKFKRVCMAMECLVPHGSHNTELVPLNHFLNEERLTESEALYILYNLLLVIEGMHKKEIVHREIKLSNIILNRKNLKVKLIDFYDAEFEFTEEFEHKSDDVWATGVVLYAMLYRGCSAAGATQNLQNLYAKLLENKRILLKNISDGTEEILSSILSRPPQRSLKASEAADMVRTLLAIRCSSQNPKLSRGSLNTDQVVPECPDFQYEDQLEVASSEESS